MPSPLLKVSLEEIRQEILVLIEWLESASVRHQAWAPGFLVFAREFQTMAAEQPLNAVRIKDFTNRMKKFIISHRLKGFDDVVW
jgi:hypothetical protein